MKVVNASWEKRNLGVDCNEIEIEKKDTVEMLKKRILDFETDYTVVKVPIGMINISHFLQSCGYVFMELITNCYSKLGIPKLSPIHNRIINSVSCEEMNPNDRKELFYQINNDMFIHDRISLDPFFNQDQANKRYIGWVSDELELGSTVFKLVYKDLTIGFFTFRLLDNTNTFVSSLGGLYPSLKKNGFGVCLPFFSISEGVKRNAKKILIGLSSNNKNSLALHYSFGYNNIESQFYVFVKHK